MPRTWLPTLALAALLALPACYTARRSADIDRTPSVDTGMGAAILMPGDPAPTLNAGSGGSQTRVGPEGASSSTSGSGLPSAGPLTAIGSSKIDENRHEQGKEDPLIQKWALAPLGVLAAPFVWAANEARGEPEPGPTPPSASLPAPAPEPQAVDYDSRRLAEMERELSEREASRPASTSSPSARTIADELAALQRVPQAAMQPSPPETVATLATPAPADGVVDADGDGRIDAWIYRDDGRVVRKLLDRDGDGRAETTLHYDPRTASVTRVEEDADQDGSADAWTEYRDGRVLRRRADSDGDGVIDTWTFYRDGRLSRHEQDTTGDGFRDRVGFYRDDHLEREEYDLDGDGRADVYAHYDADEQLLRREEDLDRDGEVDVISHYEGGRLSRKEVLRDTGPRTR